MTDNSMCTSSDAATRGHQDLLELVYDELRRHAASQLQRRGGSLTLQPTALVHEAWLRMNAKDRLHWKSRDHFVGAAVIAMRHILVDRIREKSSMKRDASNALATFQETTDATEAEMRILTLNECMESLAKSYPDCVKIVELKFFAGLSNEEAAAQLGCGLRTVERQWAFARAKLYQMIVALESGERSEQ